MTPVARRRPHDDRGFSLAEQLVVMVVFSVISVLVATTIIHMSFSAEDHRQRVETLGDAQIALEHVTRALRSADPLVGVTAEPCEPGRLTDAVPAPTACANALTFELVEQGTRRRVQYALTGGELLQGRETWTGSAWSSPVWSVLARKLQNGAAPQSPLFALTDGGGKPTTVLTDVGRINVVVVGSSTRRRPTPLPVTAEVTVRNRLYRSVG